MLAPLVRRRAARVEAPILTPDLARGPRIKFRNRLLATVARLVGLNAGPRWKGEFGALRGTARGAFLIIMDFLAYVLLFVFQMNFGMWQYALLFGTLIDINFARIFGQSVNMGDSRKFAKLVSYIMRRIQRNAKLFLKRISNCLASQPFHFFKDFNKAVVCTHN